MEEGQEEGEEEEEGQEEERSRFGARVPNIVGFNFFFSHTYHRALAPRLRSTRAARHSPPCRPSQRTTDDPGSRSPPPPLSP